MDDWVAVAAELTVTASVTGIFLAPFVDAGAAFAAAGAAAFVSLSASTGVGMSGDRLAVATGCVGAACDTAGAISAFGAAVSAVPGGPAGIETASAVTGTVTAAGITAAALPISVGAISPGATGAASAVSGTVFADKSAVAIAAAANNTAESEPAVGRGVEGCGVTVADTAGVASSFAASVDFIGCPLSSEADASIAGALAHSDLAAAVSSPTGALPWSSEAGFPSLTAGSYLADASGVSSGRRCGDPD
jgi:hypothetical protein